jgi:hypothetical protein
MRLACVSAAASRCGSPTRGGQPFYSPLAILTALTLRAVFRLAYRQAEGLIGSIISLLGLTLRVPDHTTLSRRSATLTVPPPRVNNAGAAASDSAQPLHLLVDSTGQRGARIDSLHATTPTSFGVRRCGHSSGVPDPACG